MTSNEKLLMAIGQISDDIIKEAEGEYKRKTLPLRKSLSIAASVALVAVVITLLPAILNLRFDKNAGGNSAPGMNAGMMGGENGSLDIREEDFGSLIYNGKTSDNVYRFTLIIMTDATKPIDVYLYSADEAIVYTTASGVTGVTEMRRPEITVNGEPSDRIPTEIGEYEITIAFPNLDSTINWKTIFKIGDFGDFHRFSWN